MKISCGEDRAGPPVEAERDRAKTKTPAAGALAPRASDLRSGFSLSLHALHNNESDPQGVKTPYLPARKLPLSSGKSR
jgi:hypothetical protein